ADMHADRRARRADEAVLVAHLFTAGGVPCVDSERPLVVGGSGRGDPQTLAGWAYVALGHLHRPQAIGGREGGRHSGSLLKYSFAEHDHEKGVTIVDTVLGKATVQPILFQPRRDLVRIEGTFDELMHDGRFAAAEPAYVEATYTDAGYVIEAAQRLRTR